LILISFKQNFNPEFPSTEKWRFFVAYRFPTFRKKTCGLRLKECKVHDLATKPILNHTALKTSKLAKF